MGEAFPLFLGEGAFVGRAEIWFPGGDACGYEIAIQAEVLAAEERLFAAADVEEDGVDGRDGDEVGTPELVQNSEIGDRFCEEGEEGFRREAGEFAGGFFLYYQIGFAGRRG